MSGAAALLLKVESVTKVFGSERTLVRAVDDVSFQVRAGEVVLIMGPSGSGKTTLLSMLGTILHPTSGRIWIDGTETTALARRRLPRVRRELIGFVFQTFNLLETLSARENVQIVLDIAGRTGPLAAARAAGLLAAVGLESRLDFRAAALSAGERQRVSIARALANEPRLLLADEPTANLDSAAGADVMHLLRDITVTGGHGAVVVSHDDRLQAIADRVLVLEDGSIRRDDAGGRSGSGLPEAPTQRAPA